LRYVTSWFLQHWRDNPLDLIVVFATLVLVVLTGLQWRAQKESTRLSTRAWLTPKSFDFLNTLAEGQVPSAQIVFHNSGGSPAINVRFRWRVGFVGNNIQLGSEMPLAEASENQSVGVIGATAEYRAATTFTRPVAAQDIADIRGRQGRWMAFGRVTYDDIFSQSHYTEYCIEFEPSDGTARLCSQWNRAT
jgi:hypothetical protein